MKIVEDLFGKHWIRRLLLFLLVYSLIICWPLVVFYKDIRFNPAAFTQDWVKTVIGLSFLFLVLEYQKALFEIRRKNAVLRDILQRDLLTPVSAFMYQLQVEDPSGMRTEALFAEWAALYPRLRNINLGEHARRLGEPKLATFLTAYGLDRLEMKIREAYAAARPLDNVLVLDCLNPFIRTLEIQIKELQ